MTLEFQSDVPDDIEAIASYLIEASDEALAERFRTSLKATLDRLVEMPEAHAPKPFKLKVLRGLRSWAISGFPKHLIYYRVLGDVVEIVAITHGARNLPGLLRKRV